ncbi:CLUMA_CG016789, isoform A [Clunio marinus]|uniref:CLUMA_CG016789, isoform A n=1 Tax=Clunio marinus TaxID=568069 RepID=A0A1J1IT31_9DIPT|nr:CLUMA_CG016789, isoform A [Clunio marinus]
MKFMGFVSQDTQNKNLKNAAVAIGLKSYHGSLSLSLRTLKIQTKVTGIKQKKGQICIIHLTGT